MTKGQVITIVVDAVFTIASAIVGFWLAPDYRDVALAIIGALQPAALAVILYLAGVKQIQRLRAEIEVFRDVIKRMRK